MTACHLNHRVLLKCRVAIGMDSFWQAFTGCLESVPIDVLDDSEGLFVPEDLPNPKRLKIAVPALSGEEAVHEAHAALRDLAGLLNAVGDVANLDDLHGFPELDSCMPEPGTGMPEADPP